MAAATNPARELTLPVFARLGTTEVQLGVLTLSTDADPAVEISTEQLSQAGRVLTPALTGEHTAPPTGRETIWVRTEVGVIQAMDLPLAESIQDRLNKGYLQRVNQDGTAYLPPAGQQPLTRPAGKARKADWVGYLVRRHGLPPDDAEAMTIQDLIDKADQLDAGAPPAAPGAHDPAGENPPLEPTQHGPLQRPPTAANKTAWVEWAVAAHGLDRADAEGKTVAELQTLS